MRATFAMILVLAAFLAAFAGFVAPLLGAETGATAQVREVLDKAMEIQTRPALEGLQHRKERMVLIRKLISESFLAAEMARDSLSEFWDKIAPAQRQQYEELFSSLFQDSYTRMVLDYLKKENVEYGGESPEGKYTKVKTVIKRPDEHIPVDYILERKGQKWFIRDVIIEGVSAVENYRTTFGQVIRKQSFEQLIQKMRIQKKAGEMGDN